MSRTERNDKTKRFRQEVEDAITIVIERGGGRWIWTVLKGLGSGLREERVRRGGTSPVKIESENR